MAEGTQLAERGKEQITAAAAIELLKKFIKERYKADKVESDRAIEQARQFAGGQIERLDKDVIDQGRQWATRLALISRQTAGSGYQASKSGAALGATVKKIFAIVGELEALMAVDTEISLFGKLEERDYYGYDTLRVKGRTVKDLVADLANMGEPGEIIDAESIIATLTDDLGEKVQDAAIALLSQYEIEPIVVPEEEPAKNGRRRRRS